MFPRAMRAAWYHALALSREFRVPIVGFILLVGVGGLIYGELYEALRGVTVPLIVRPYVILQLMILEAPEAVPPELPLVAFWYVMPVGFVLLISLGAADFVNLVFNRDDQRNPWAEALALTYRNHIVVFGAGHVGQRVIKDLVTMGLDVVAIDQSPSTVAEQRLGEMGVPIVRGDGRLAVTLDKARLGHAEAFVACTGNDQVNMEAIMRVRHGHPEIRIVARMWDRRFAEQLETFLKVHSVLSSADLAAPAFAGAAHGCRQVVSRGEHRRTSSDEARSGHRSGRARRPCDRAALGGGRDRRGRRDRVLRSARSSPRGLVPKHGKEVRRGENTPPEEEIHR